MSRKCRVEGGVFEDIKENITTYIIEHRVVMVVTSKEYCGF